MRLLVLLALFVVPALAAQPFTFVNEGGPPDGLLPVMHETLSGVLLAVDEIGRVGRSADGGDTWTVIELDGVRSFSESPGELLTATGSGVYRSTDDGATWRADSTSVFRKRAQDGNVYRTVMRECRGLVPCNDLLRWDEQAARCDTLTTPDLFTLGAVGGIDALPDGSVYLATYALGLLDIPVGGLFVYRPGEGWKRYGTYAASLSVRPDNVFVGGLEDVFVLKESGLQKIADIPAPVTMLAGRTALFASTGGVCYSALDGTSPCDLPTSAYRIDPQTGETSPVGFGQQALYVLSDIDGLTAVGRTGIWKRTQQCDYYGCTLAADWTFERTSPSYPGLARNLAPTPWGDLLLSADYWYGPGLFVGNDSTWESRVPADFGISAIALGDSVILSLHVNGLWRSADRGETFEQISDDYEAGGALFNLFGSTPYWGRADGIYGTGDDGKTWTRTFDTTPYGPVRAVDDWSNYDLWGSYVLAGRHVLRSTFGEWEVESVFPESVALGGYPDEVEMAMGRYVRVRDTMWVYDYDTSAWSGNAIPGGASWQGHRMTVASDGYLYLATASGLLRSEQPVFVGTENQSATPSATALRLWPNPATAAVTIQPGAKTGRVEVFDVLGRRVARIADGPLGETVVWDASGLSAGLYVVRLTTAGHTETWPLVVVR